LILALTYVTDVTIVNSIPGGRVSRKHERSFSSSVNAR